MESKKKGMEKRARNARIGAKEKTHRTWCLSRLTSVFLLNLFAVIVLTVFVSVGTALNGTDSYIRFGPGTDEYPLNVLSVNIDTWLKWGITVFILVLLALSDVIISQTAMIDLYNNIYNSAHKEVTDFATPAQLQVYAQFMYLMNSFRYILSVKINITQIDLALITSIASQLTTIPVIREKVLAKVFRPKENPGRFEDEPECEAYPSHLNPIHSSQLCYNR